MSKGQIRLVAADGATAHIHSRGAHITHWMPAGETRSRLFLSERAVYAEGVPIRGGVPVIFPQFAGQGPLPKHGFARTALWALQSTDQSQGTDAQAVFTLQDSPATRAIWDHAFLATLTVRLGGRQLSVRLQVRNTGAANFTFTAALHSYLAVDDISQVDVEGLRALHYSDTAAGGCTLQERAERVRIEGAVDRNYFASPADLLLHDGRRTLQLHQQGFADTVLWNPGAAQSAGFADLAPEDYRRFVCIEAAAIQHPITLAAGEQWLGEQRFRA